MNSTKFGFSEKTVSEGRLSEGYFAFGWARESAEFMRLKKFPRVVFEGTWGDFGFISEFSDHIVELILENDTLEAKGVDTLKNLKGLWTRFKSKEPINFNALQELEICSIYWDKAYSKSLFALQALRKVTIHSFGSDDFNDIALNSNISTLDLVRSKLHSLNGIDKLDELTELNLTFASKLKNIDELCSLPKLTALTIVNAPNVENFPKELKIQSLKKLVLSNVGSLHDVTFLGSMKSLVTLSIGGSAVSPNWAGLIDLPNLKKMQLLVNKSETPSETILREMVIGSGKKIKEFKFVNIGKSPCASVQIDFA